MSDCEIDRRIAAAAFDNLLLLRCEPREEAGYGVSVEEGAKDLRLLLRPSAEARVSVDRGSGVMDCAADAARAFADEARGSEGARSRGDSGRGAGVCAGGVFGASEAEAGDGAWFSDAGAGKWEHGSRYFLSKQVMADTGSFGEGSVEDVGAKPELRQTRVPVLYGTSTEVLEASEATGGWMHGFEVGDMVWGKVKSHPWWPGHIFNEAFASSPVRRTKREGHVLVAFFGDSSYGWFDPAELIPFEPHYAEKSKQTTSRNFTKAVEEAVDEANRRSALGLSCCCRNPFNFRPTTVPGYFVVDVAGYEPGGVYSSRQISKARDDFATVEVLSFVNRLAALPRNSEQGSIDLIKKTATLLALRKAMFEEFDVTYAEAFGVQPVLPSRATQGGSDQLEKVPIRAAPLSGPLVIAEALGERKASGKAVVRAKDSSAKKNKYLFKRREEPPPGSPSLKSPPSSAAGPKQRPPSSIPGHAPELQYAGQPEGTVHYSGHAAGQLPQPNVHYMPHVQADVVVAAADDSYAAEVGNYVLQKRVPDKQQSVPTKQEADRTPVPEFGGFSPESLDRAAEPSGRSHPPVQDVGVKPEEPAGGEPGARGPLIHQGSATVPVGSGDGDKSSHHEYKPVVDDQGKQVVQAVGFTGATAHAAPSPMDFDTHHRKTSHTKGVGDVVHKKEKARKHPPEEAEGEKKKKRKRKEGALEGSMDHPPLKHKKKNGESLKLSSAGNSISIGLTHSDNSLAEAEMKADGALNSLAPASEAAILQQLPKLDLASHALDLPGVLGDLSALALDPFYGAERNVGAAVRHVLLRFRSLVYEKALPFPPTGEHETCETHAAKFRAGSGRPPQEVRREQHDGVAKEGEAREASKPHKTKPVLKAEDPTRMVRKRLPSDRQEEKLAKRLKKLDKLKALTSEKKAGLVNKTTDVQQRGEHKESGSTVVAPAKFPKPDSIKKPEAPTPPKAAIPTYLLMKFPQRTTLPSVSSLKARFARFGPLDLSGTRVFWKSYTCRVLFKHKSDAQSAYNYAQSNDIFGLVKVNYLLRELESPAADAASDAVTRSGDTPQFRPAGGADLAADLKPKQQSLYSGQLKSILKKPSEEAAPAGGSGVAKEAPRVKFMLGGDDGRGDPPAVVVVSNSSSSSSSSSISISGNNNSNNNNGGSKTGGIGILPTPPLLDMNRKAPSKSVTFLQPLQPPLQPPRPQDMHPVPLSPLPAPRVALPDMPGPRGALQPSNPSPRQVRFGEVEETERGGVDISHQLLSLLARCSDIVTNVKSALGYVPYHPL